MNNSVQMCEFCRDKGFTSWFETSAKENINIDEAARCLVAKVRTSAPSDGSTHRNLSALWWFHTPEPQRPLVVPHTGTSAPPGGSTHRNLSALCWFHTPEPQRPLVVPRVTRTCPVGNKLWDAMPGVAGADRCSRASVGSTHRRPGASGGAKLLWVLTRVVWVPKTFRVRVCVCVCSWFVVDVVPLRRGLRLYTRSLGAMAPKMDLRCKRFRSRASTRTWTVSSLSPIVFQILQNDRAMNYGDDERDKDKLTLGPDMHVTKEKSTCC